MNRTVAQLLGEAIESDAAADAQVAPEAPVEAPDYSNPSVDQLLALWQSGNHEAVALRVLDALDRYRDFLDLALRLGHAGAMELGELMDQLTADQKSPHQHDQLPDEAVPLKFGRGPAPAEADLAGGSMQ